MNGLPFREASLPTNVGFDRQEIRRRLLIEED
jgi:hypothetical protein